jgi:branched-subunit amino acid transport protein
LTCGVVTRLTRRVPLMEQKLLTLPEHLSSPPVFSGARGTGSLILCVCFVDRCLSFCPFSIVYCVVCSSIYIFWLPLWYLQILFKQHQSIKKPIILCLLVFQISHLLNYNAVRGLFRIDGKLQQYGRTQAIQHYVIKFVWSVVFSSNKTVRHDITKYCWKRR